MFVSMILVYYLNVEFITIMWYTDRNHKGSKIPKKTSLSFLNWTLMHRSCILEKKELQVVSVTTTRVA